MTSSLQIAEHFLCEECEDRFSKGGERHVVGCCARPNGEFKLREYLLGTAPVLGDTQFRIYNVENLEQVRAKQYLYFAASVFWRAAARTWKFGSRPLKRLSLGTQYQEQFRLYLLGRADFPSNGRVFIHVWSNDPVDNVTAVPSTTRVDDARRHKFCIPGLAFILFLGANVSRRHDAAALNSKGGEFMWLCRWENDSLFRGFLELLAKSPPAGSLRRRYNREHRLTRGCTRRSPPAPAGEPQGVS